MSVKNGRKNKVFLFLIIFFVVSVIAGIFTNLVQSIKYEIYSERTFHLRETMLTIAEKINLVLKKQWDSLYTAEKILFIQPHSNISDLEKSLGFVMESVPTDASDFVAIDNQGMCYTGRKDIESYSWNETNLLLNDEQTQITLQNKTQYALSSSEYMIFLRKLTIPMEIKGEGVFITHIAIFQDIASFQDLFKSKVYKNQNKTLIISDSDKKIYYDFENAEFSDGKFLEKIKDDEFLYDKNFEIFLDDFNSGATSSFQIIHDKKKYFVGFTLLDGNWRYVLAVPSEYVSENSARFTQTLFYALALFSSILIVLIIVLVIIISVAINANKKAQIEKENSERLKEANEAVKKAESSARKANLAKTEFLSNMSHDIRTPINGIIGMLDIAELYDNDVLKLKDCLSKIRGAANHLLVLVNDVLDMSKAESGKIELSKEPFNLLQIIYECADMLKDQAVNNEIKIDFDVEKITKPYLLGSPLHLRQILLNILGNAVKYTKPGGKVHIKAIQTEEKDKKILTEISVEDTGIGMRKEFIPHIFDAFSQADNSIRSEFRGTGLGMAITKKLVELMNGKIFVQSELNKGSTFTVSIPLEIEKNSTSEKEKITENKIEIKGMKIILAEDNELNREIARTLLEEKGAIITEAFNGKEAFDLFEKNESETFDLILMDIMMPEMNGLEATKKIRQSNKKDAKTIPIIAMTANAFAEDVAAAKEAGMNEHLSKPLNIETLLKTINQYKKK